MTKVIAALMAALFCTAALSPVAFAAEEKKAAKKPTAEECKKDPKMTGCEPAKK